MVHFICTNLGLVVLCGTQEEHIGTTITILTLNQFLPSHWKKLMPKCMVRLNKRANALCIHVCTSISTFLPQSRSSTEKCRRYPSVVKNIKNICKACVKDPHTTICITSVSFRCKDFLYDVIFFSMSWYFCHCLTYSTYMFTENLAYTRACTIISSL